jgi:hypothetical protein
MASSGTLTNGTTTYSSTIAAVNTAETVTFADRYNYVAITNLGTDPVYVRADGQAAGVAANNSYVVAPGATQLLSNGAALWYQSSNVIPKGAIQVGNGNAYQGNINDAKYNPSTATQPGTVTPMESLAGYTTTYNVEDTPAVQVDNYNPGTTVSLISAGSGATQPYTVAAAG